MNLANPSHIFIIISQKYREVFRPMMKLLGKTKAREIVGTCTSGEDMRKSKTDGAITIISGILAHEYVAIVHSVDASDNPCKNTVK